MKKTYQIEVDCANCANLMEEATKKTEGVQDAVVNFMTQKMIVEFAEGSVPKEETLIFLYYSDFTVNRMMSGTVTCDVRFQILTTLDRSLNNLSVRLRWPNMETALSFSDIPPNQPVHYDYTLLGDGCYSMDRIPNIIVNRCRVKGLSQQDCAAKIRWLRK